MYFIPPELSEQMNRLKKKAEKLIEKLVSSYFYVLKCQGGTTINMCLLLWIDMVITVNLIMHISRRP